MIDALSMLSKVGAGFAAGGSVIAPHAPAAPAGASFASMLGGTFESAVGSLKQAEAVSIRALSGDADTRTVVDAVMAAEQSLQTAIAVRDKLVSAYLEISRMTI